MSGTLEQPSASPERSPERHIKYVAPVQDARDVAAAQRTEDPKARVQGDNMVVPPLGVKGFQNDGTTGNTNLPEHITLSNPYQDWTLDIAGRKWAAATDVGAAQVSPEAQRRAGADTHRPVAQALAAGDTTNKNILDAAKGVVDQQVWKGSRHERATQNGKFGGAASVSKLLQGLGYSYADSPGVSALSNQLIGHGWNLVGMNQMKPGDIVFGGKTGTDWRNGGGNGRIGVVGEDGKIYYNNPETGKWTQASMDDAFSKQQFGDQVWVLRPPAGGPPPRETAQNAGPQTLDRRRPGRSYEPDPQQYGNPRDQYGRRGRQQDYTDFRGRQSWDGQNDGRYPTGDNSQNNFNPLSILFHAVEGLGQALWAMTPFRNSVRGGRLGCAASVSHVLNRAGYQYANSAGVGGLESQLMRNGWRRAPLSQASAGDVVVVGRSPGWRGGGGSAHVGIVGENGSVYHNSSARGQWIKDNLQSRFGRGMENFVLKPPPGAGSHRIDPRLFNENFNPEPRVAPQGTRTQGDQFGQPFGQPFGDQRQYRGRNNGYDQRGGYDDQRYGGNQRYGGYDNQRYGDQYNQNPMARFTGMMGGMDPMEMMQRFMRRSGHDRDMMRNHRRHHRYRGRY